MGLAPIRNIFAARGAMLLAVVCLSISAATASPVTYTVDPASGRVIRADYPDGSYVVYQYDGNGNRLSATVTRALDTVPPTAPGAPAFSNITATSATATWTEANDDRGVTSYEWSRNGGSSWNSVGTALTASITGLTGSTSYTVLVRARDAAGNAGATSSNSFTTSDVTAPSAPGTPGFSNITATSATATWTGATDNIGVTGYEWSRNGGSTWTSVGTALSASITGLTGSTSYTVLVRARDAAGNIGPHSSNSFATSDTTAPGAPGTPTFSAITASSATATWTAATDNIGVTAYEWSRNGGSTWTSVGTSLSASISGLTGSTNYTVLVRARDAAGNIGPNSSNSFTTIAAADTSPPTAPGTPGFNTITATSANATWAAASDNVGVTAYEYSLNGGAWTSTGSASPGFSLIGLTSGVTHTFAVRARDAANNTGTSTSNSFTTLDNVAPTAPGAPVFSSITGTSATATWTAASDNVGVTGYQYSLNGGAWTNASSGVSLTGLTNGTTYTLQVRARDAAANFGNASANSFTTQDTAGPSAPGTPAFSSITGSSAIASWSAASDNVGVSGYEYSLSGGSWTAASSGVTLTGLTNGTSYSLQVRAFDAAGNRGAASANSFTTQDTAAPGAPGTPGFSSITGSSAVASWSAASDNVGVSGYEYSLNGSAWAAASPGMTLSGLTNGTNYSFQVRAFDAAGNRGSASANSFTTLDTAAPGAPGTPTFSSVGATSAVVSFSAASDNVGVAGYEYLLNGAGWSVANSGMTLTGLATGASYTVHVRAYDGAGNRGEPSVNSFTTVDNIAPGAPGTPSFSSIGSTTAVATWSAASDNLGVTSYEYSVNGGSWVNVGNTTSATVSGLSAAASNTVGVRARDAAGNAGSPSSGSVTTLAQITIANRNVNTVVSTGFSGGSAIYQLTSAGDIMVTQPTSSTAIDGGDWLAPKSGMGSFQVMSTQVSSSACSSATHGTWLNLSSNQTWVVGRGGPSGTTACTFDIQIRHSSNPSVILGTARIGISITN
jgi:YD repeat-containing protein